MIFDRALRKRSAEPQNAVTSATIIEAGVPAAGFRETGAKTAMRLSTVNRCVEALSDSIGKLPVYVMDRSTRKKVEEHPLNKLLSVRANEAQSPLVCKKMVEGNRLCGGNGYLWILRDPGSLRPVELIPVPHELVTPWLDEDGRLWYSIIHPFTGAPLTVHRADMIHLMAYTYNGWKGVSVLQRASDVIRAGQAAQGYTLNYYERGGQPAGVLYTDTDLQKTITRKLPDGSSETVKLTDVLREEWELRNSGPTNAHRIAVLDHGLQYKPISVSNKDAQFVEQSELSVQDIARFFGVPLYKLQAGKQSYESNEQNAIEYVVSTLHPIVTQYEEELTWKLLTSSEIARGLEIRINMMAELRGDFGSRGTWFETLRNIGVFSANDILALEDLPDVEGGDERYASLNYVPLSLWRELSVNRNKGGNGNADHT